MVIIMFHISVTKSFIQILLEFNSAQFDNRSFQKKPHRIFPYNIEIRFP